MEVTIRIPLASIRRDSHQVRKTFNEEGLEGLTRSMEEVGLLQPVLVRQAPEGYQLVAGARRLRAAERLGHEDIPAIVLDSDVRVKQVQLIENLQREDLNPIERAEAVNEFMVAEGLTKVAAAERLGIPRTTLTDWLDVLEVDERYQRAVRDNFYGGDSPLTLSHVSEARALAARLRSPSICEILLDAVMKYRLSKVETREVCALIRSNEELTVEQAVRLIRRPVEVNKLAGDAEDERMAVERNLAKWVSTLERSSDTLSELQRIAPRYLPRRERERIVRHLKDLLGLAEEALEHIAVESPSAGRRAAKVS